MKWFGRHWGAQGCDETEHTETPVGETCPHCEEDIQAGDNGFVMPAMSEDGPTTVALHLECHMHNILGGVNHQMKKCTCFGGTLDSDPPDISKREAARLACAYHESQRAMKH